MSDEKSLLTALLAVQAEAPTLPKDKSNPAFKGSKYTSLDTIVETVGPLLNRHGLVWTTLPTTTEQGAPALMYRLIHAATDQHITGTMPLLLSKQDAQGLGSALTYARRYSLCAVLNLVADDDDDGHGASQRRPAAASSDAPTEPQMRELGRQVKAARPSVKTLGAMLRQVGVEATEAQLADGSWATSLKKGHVSALLDMFASAVLPTGESDIPSDLDPDDAARLVDEQLGDVPFETQEPVS